MTLANKKERRRQNLNKHIKRNLNLAQTKVRTVHMCVYHCAQLSYTTQHRAVPIIFPLIRRGMSATQPPARSVRPAAGSDDDDDDRHQ